ncbi:MAG: endonuclease III [Omnitrophica bacterium RIFCSPLOWO2_12_FULL_44_17]|uniref:Endonuclease III n=1 Tax=Candidatus Danuiimicrobium aquiferis TaxID=1801832 RepID=A0A1G1KT15_9BACT|nr:MAG: endonuclease III [Omnitrophica bacterium RIFCSPHIGHO2_02_FULL_45_28]OGW91512.1 MAG: endonuclease III [Omnitrophica bacterium RIFCSPHIGHO2_12_FULL_44_12]OGW96104.1 MAG: endonuclease III [Omnitrophica bacterium RIFCSPLOWO2_12_FULL_44_17]OGX04653.1 MAG: endonuclease III [Omnitrophica bacterium RIFCSPLOWO2_02_FULL_44_11]
MPESIRSKRKRAHEIIKRLKKKIPDAKIALVFKNPTELLVATILSAQCTDKRVNMVTADLFKKYKTARDYADADSAMFESEIRSTGFYKAKAKNIIGAANEIVKRFNGKVPDRMEYLVTLPGVGRKTANVILGNAYGIPGIAVDTHMIRLSYRLGFTEETDPEKIEFDLYEIIPEKEWVDVNHLIIWHGRLTCVARKPKCEGCVVNDLCPKKGVKLK